MGDLVTRVPLFFTLTPLYRTCHILAILGPTHNLWYQPSLWMTPIASDLFLVVVVLRHLQKRANEPYKKKKKKQKTKKRKKRNKKKNKVI